MNKALLVGINKYKMSGNDLYGCVNDVTNMRDILLRYAGFLVENVRVVTDERATYDNIVDRLEWLIRDIQPEDNLVFHFSGHGSQIRDRNGDELKDSLDEILCPYDMDWDEHFISDDELHSIFSKLQAGTLDVILDCCHSGTGTRNPHRIKCINPPVDIVCREADEMQSRGIFQWLMSLFKPEENEDKPIVTLNHSLMAGCRDNQTCADAEIGGKPAGAFTYYLCKHIRDAKGVVARKALKDRTKRSLAYNGFEQVPQLEASKKLFYGAMFT